jgi:translocator protein
MRRPWLLTIPIVLLAGLASGWLSGSGYGTPWFDGLRKPWFMPPGWVFPIVWTTLYILMGVALSDLIRARARTAIALFALQLALNLAWSPLFFAAHRTAGALALIVAIDVAVAATIVAAARVRLRPALLLVPYAAWLALATALNLAILRLNPTLP